MIQLVCGPSAAPGSAGRSAAIPVAARPARATSSDSKSGGLPPIHNPYLFGGRYYDEPVESYDFRARQYSPLLGRFLQRDPERYTDSVAQADHPTLAELDFAARPSRPRVRHMETNLYTYTHNSPLVFRDPSGRETNKWVEGGLQSVQDWTKKKIPTSLRRIGIQPFYGAASPYARWDEQRCQEHLTQWNENHPELIRRSW